VPASRGGGAAQAAGIIVVPAANLRDAIAATLGVAAGPPDGSAASGAASDAGLAESGSRVAVDA